MTKTLILKKPLYAALYKASVRGLQRKNKTLRDEREAACALLDTKRSELRTLREAHDRLQAKYAGFDAQRVALNTPAHVAPDSDLVQCLTAFENAITPLARQGWGAPVDVKGWVAKVKLTAMLAPAPPWRPIFDELISTQNELHRNLGRMTSSAAEGRDAKWRLDGLQNNLADLQKKCDTWSTRHAFVSLQLKAAIDANRRVAELYRADQTTIADLTARLNDAENRIRLQDALELACHKPDMPLTLHGAHNVINVLRAQVSRARIPLIDYQAAIEFMESKVAECVHAMSADALRMKSLCDDVTCQKGMLAACREDLAHSDENAIKLQAELTKAEYVLKRVARSWPKPGGLSWYTTRKRYEQDFARKVR